MSSVGLKEKILQAKELCESGQYAKGLKACKGILELLKDETFKAKVDPQNKISSNLHLLAGRCALFLEHFDESEEFLKEATVQKPNFMPALTLLAQLYRRTGKWDDLIGIKRSQIDIAESKGNVQKLDGFYTDLAKALEMNKQEDSKQKALEAWEKVRGFNLFTGLDEFNVLNNMINLREDILPQEFDELKSLYDCMFKVQLAKKRKGIISSFLHSITLSLMAIQETPHLSVGEHINRLESLIQTGEAYTKQMELQISEPNQEASEFVDKEFHEELVRTLMTSCALVLFIHELIMLLQTETQPSGAGLIRFHSQATSEIAQSLLSYANKYSHLDCVSWRAWMYYCSLAMEIGDIASAKLCNDLAVASLKKCKDIRENVIVTLEKHLNNDKPKKNRVVIMIQNESEEEKTKKRRQAVILHVYRALMENTVYLWAERSHILLYYWQYPSSVSHEKISNGALLSAERGIRTTEVLQDLTGGIASVVKQRLCCDAIRAALNCGEFAKAEKYVRMCETSTTLNSIFPYQHLAIGDYLLLYKEAIEDSAQEYRKYISVSLHEPIVHTIAAKAGLARALLHIYRVYATTPKTAKRKQEEVIRKEVIDLVNQVIESTKVDRDESQEAAVTTLLERFSNIDARNLPGLVKLKLSRRLPSYLPLQALMLMYCDVEPRQDAFTCLVKAAKLDPYNAETFALLGHFYRKVKADFVRAVKCYEKSFNLQHLQHEVILNLSHLYHKEQKQILAANLYRAVIASLDHQRRRGIDISSPELMKIRLFVWLHLGQQQLAKEKYDAAKSSFLKALPFSKTIVTELINGNCDKKKCNEAESHELLMYLLTNHQGLGDSYLYLGQYTASMRTYEEILTLIDDCPHYRGHQETLDALAYSLFRLGSISGILQDYDISVAYLEKAAALDKQSHSSVSLPVLYALLNSLLNHSKAHLKLGNFTRAMVVANSALSIIQEEYVDTHSGVEGLGITNDVFATLLKTMGDINSFIAVSFPVMKDSAFVSGECDQLFRSCNATSIKIYTKLIFHQPWIVSTWQNLAVHLNLWCSQLEVLGASVAEIKHSLTVGQRIGECALVLDPLNPDSWNNLGTFHRTVRSDPTEKPQCESILIQQHCFARATQLQMEGNTVAWNNLGALYAENNENKLAMECFNETDGGNVEWTGRGRVLAATATSQSDEMVLAAHRCAFDFCPDGVELTEMDSCLEYLRTSLYMENIVDKQEWLSIAHAAFKVVNRNPKSAFAHFVRGHAMEMLEYYNEAASAYNHARMLISSGKHILISDIARCLNKAGCHSEAVQLIQGLTSSGDIDEPLETFVEELAKGLLGIGDFAAVIDLCKRYANVKSSPELQAVLFESYVRFGEIESALEVMENRFLDVSNWTTRQVDKVCLAATLNIITASKALSKFCNQCSSAVLATLFAATGQSNEARVVLSRKIFMEPWSQVAWFDLAEYYLDTAMVMRRESTEAAYYAANATRRAAMSGLQAEGSGRQRFGSLLLGSSLLFLGELKAAYKTASKYLASYPWDKDGLRLFLVVVLGLANEEGNDYLKKTALVIALRLCEASSLSQEPGIERTLSEMLLESMDWMALGQAKASAGENPVQFLQKSLSLLENVSECDNIASSDRSIMLAIRTLCKLGLARYYSSINQQESALKEYFNAVKLSPTDSGLWQEVGNYAEKQGLKDIASHCYQSGAQICDITSTRTFLGRCTAQTKLALYLTYSQGYSKGLEVMGKITKIWPDVGEVNFVRGYLHERLGQVTKARLYYDKALHTSVPQGLKLTDTLFEILDKDFEKV